MPNSSILNTARAIRWHWSPRCARKSGRFPVWKSRWRKRRRGHRRELRCRLRCPGMTLTPLPAFPRRLSGASRRFPVWWTCRMITRRPCRSCSSSPTGIGSPRRDWIRRASGSICAWRSTGSRLASSDPMRRSLILRCVSRSRPASRPHCSMSCSFRCRRVGGRCLCRSWGVWTMWADGERSTERTAAG